MRSSLFVVAFAVCAACATTPAPAPEKEVIPANPCDAVDAMVATRVPKPAAYPNCSSPPLREQYKAECDAGKLVSCHQLGTCLVADAVFVPDLKNSRLETARKILKISCAGGLAESCTLRSGAGTELGMKAEATCDDLTRASQLGDGASTGVCFANCLNYTPTAP